jgi:SPP1 family predicted phage head-tail adaptor
MRAGAMDRYITIQTNTPSKDGGGTNISSWGTHATVWAQKIDMGSRETLQAGGLLMEIDTVWKIRYLSTVTTAMRVSFDSATWDIKGIKELGRNEGLELICKRVRT